jgi:hypothetical protein
MGYVCIFEPRSEREILLDLSRKIRQETDSGDLSQWRLNRLDELFRKVRPEGVPYNDAPRRLHQTTGVEHEELRTEIYLYCERIARALVH